VSALGAGRVVTSSIIWLETEYRNNSKRQAARSAEKQAQGKFIITESRPTRLRGPKSPFLDMGVREHRKLTSPDGAFLTETKKKVPSLPGKGVKVPLTT